MSVDANDLIAKMEWAAANGLREMVFTLGRTEVKLRRDGPASAPPVVAAPLATPASDPQPDTSATDVITAPLAGLCHLKPDPENPPFLRPGDSIEAGQTICIIEAMKVMTAIPAPQAGRVEEVFVSDGASVAVGTPLMRLE